MAFSSSSQLRWAPLGLTLGLACMAGSAPPKTAQAAETALCAQQGDFWSRPKSGPRRRGCALLLRANARLDDEPAQARDWAREAHVELVRAKAPEAPRAEWVEAYAELLLGNSARAHALFEQSAADPSELPVRFRLARARAAQLDGHPELSLASYRAWAGTDGAPLGPRETCRGLLEAAFAALRLGPAHLREARTYAEQAERAGEPLLLDSARALRVLIALRGSEPALAAELVRTLANGPALIWLWESGPAPSVKQGGLLPVLLPGDAAALLGAVAR